MEQWLPSKAVGEVRQLLHQNLKPSIHLPLYVPVHSNIFTGLVYASMDGILAATHLIITL